MQKIFDVPQQNMVEVFDVRKNICNIFRNINKLHTFCKIRNLKLGPNTI